MEVLLLGTLLDVPSDLPDNDAEPIPPEVEIPHMPQAVNRGIAVTVPLPPRRPHRSGRGPNGSGKSILLRTIGGLDDYFDGRRTYSRDVTVGYLAQ